MADDDATAPSDPETSPVTVKSQGGVTWNFAPGSLDMSKFLRAEVEKNQAKQKPATSMADLEIRDFEQDMESKQKYADALLKMLAAQVIVTNLVFIVYAAAGKSWNVPQGVMCAWLGSTVVELVGIATIVVRYLFPRRDQS